VGKDLLVAASAAPSRTEDGKAAFARNPDEYPTGVAIAIVRFGESRPAVASDESAAQSPIAEGEYAWPVLSVREVEPVPVKGKLSFYDVSDEIIREKSSPKAA